MSSPAATPTEGFMNPDDGVAVARRAVLTALGGAAGAIAGIGSAAARAPGAPARPAASHMRAIQAEYQRLLPLWRQERARFAHSSNTRDYWSGPHGRAIVALGAAIIPQLMREIRNGDFLFDVPLAMITGVDVANGETVSEQAKSALWLRWWEEARAASP